MESATENVDRVYTQLLVREFESRLQIQDENAGDIQQFLAQSKLRLVQPLWDRMTPNLRRQYNPVSAFLDVLLKENPDLWGYLEKSEINCRVLSSAVSKTTPVNMEIAAPFTKFLGSPTTTDEENPTVIPGEQFQQYFANCLLTRETVRAREGIMCHECRADFPDGDFFACAEAKTLTRTPNDMLMINEQSHVSAAFQHPVELTFLRRHYRLIGRVLHHQSPSRHFTAEFMVNGASVVAWDSIYPTRASSFAVDDSRNPLTKPNTKTECVFYVAVDMFE